MKKERPEKSLASMKVCEKKFPHEQELIYLGINYITQFLHHKLTPRDTWMVFELGGHTLSKLLFEMKGEFFKGERVYHVKEKKIILIN